MQAVCRFRGLAASGSLCCRHRNDTLRQSCCDGKRSAATLPPRRERRSDRLEARLGGTDRAGTGRERDHVDARSRAAMLGAGARLGPGPLRALPVVITGLAAQHLGRRRSRGPGARDLDLGARKLFLEPRVGSLEVVTEVLVVRAVIVLREVPQLSATAGTFSPAARRELMCPRLPAYGVASAR